MKWIGIHYYHPPRYTNRLLTIGFRGHILTWKFNKRIKTILMNEIDILQKTLQEYNIAQRLKKRLNVRDA